MNDRARFLRHRAQDCGNEFGVGRQGDILLGASLNGLDRKFFFSADPKSDNRDGNAFRLQADAQLPDIQANVDHDKIRALSPA